MSILLEAQIDVSGNVRLLEPIKLKRRSRAVVEVIEENGVSGNIGDMLEFLRNSRLPESARLTDEEIEAQIDEIRNSWD